MRKLTCIEGSQSGDEEKGGRKGVFLLLLNMSVMRSTKEAFLTGCCLPSDMVS
jgi:hypothetical protein